MTLKARIIWAISLLVVGALSTWLITSVLAWHKDSVYYEANKSAIDLWHKKADYLDKAMADQSKAQQAAQPKK